MISHWRYDSGQNHLVSYAPRADKVIVHTASVFLVICSIYFQICSTGMWALPYLVGTFQLKYINICEILKYCENTECTLVRVSAQWDLIYLCQLHHCHLTLATLLSLLACIILIAAMEREGSFQVRRTKPQHSAAAVTSEFGWI